MSAPFRPMAPPAHPMHEGSEEALKVLMAMANWKSAITHAEIVALTSLEGRTVSLALRGLKTRNRVAVKGTGPHASWMLAHRMRAAQ